MSRGRKPTTGKYQTREELEKFVRFFYFETGQCQAQVARTCGVSELVVDKIIRSRS